MQAQWIAILRFTFTYANFMQNNWLEIELEIETETENQ